jgi:hypothetical protein
MESKSFLWLIFAITCSRNHIDANRVGIGDDRRCGCGFHCGGGCRCAEGPGNRKFVALFVDQYLDGSVVLPVSRLTVISAENGNCLGKIFL